MLEKTLEIIWDYYKAKEKPYFTYNDIIKFIVYKHYDVNIVSFIREIRKLVKKNIIFRKRNSRGDTLFFINIIRLKVYLYGSQKEVKGIH